MKPDVSGLPSRFTGSYFIYALMDPRDRVVRYIGRTAIPAKRLQLHCNWPNRKNNRPFGRWIEDLDGAAVAPLLEILVEIKGYRGRRSPEHDYAKRIERLTIAWYEHQGAPLLNRVGTAAWKQPRRC